MTAGAKGIRAGKAFVELFADDSRLVRGLRSAQRRLRAFGSVVSNMGRRMALASVATAAPIAIATKIFASFSDQMAKVRAVTGASETAFGSLNDRAKELGRTTSFTASQVAGAMVELGRAGFKPDAILNSIEGVLDLARATDTDLPRAAEIAGAALRGFSLDSAEAGRVADVLTATANNSSQGLEDIGEALKVVAPIAVEAGESLEDTAAALGVLANNGIKGSLAGNSVARAYKNLSTSNAQKLLKSVGVEAVDSSGNLRKLADILSELGQVTKGFGSAKKLELFESLFGRGQAAALKLASPTANFKDLQQVMNAAQGTAKKTAKTMDDTLGGSFRMLASALEGIAIAVGSALQGSLRAFTDRLTELSGWITKVVSNNRDFVVSLLKGIAIIGAAGVSLIVLGSVFTGLSATIGAVMTIFGLLKVVILGIGAAFGALLSPIGLAVAAVVDLGAVILQQTGLGAQATDFLGEKFNNLKDTVLTSWQGIRDAIAAGDLEGAFRIVVLTLKLLWQQTIAVLKKGWIGFKQVFQQAIADGLKVVMDLFSLSVKDLVSAFVGIEKAWVHTTAFLGDAWNTFTAGFMKVWNKAKGFVAKGIIRLKKLFGANVDVNAVSREIDAETQRNNRSIDANRNRKIAERENAKRARLAEIERGRGDTERALNDFLNDDKRREKFRKQIAAADKDVVEAKKELEAAIRDAADKRKTGDGEQPGPKGSVDQKSFAAAGKQFQSTAGGKSSVVGSFSAFAVNRFGAKGGNVPQQQLNQLQQINANTKRIQALEPPKL